MEDPEHILNKMKSLTKELEKAIEGEEKGIKKGNVKIEVKEFRDIRTILNELIGEYNKYEKLTRLR
ncbi:hypothetical protein YN1_1820 [Nanoarchaeota archaeon]